MVVNKTPRTYFVEGFMVIKCCENFLCLVVVFCALHPHPTFFLPNEDPLLLNSLYFLIFFIFSFSPLWSLLVFFPLCVSFPLFTFYFSFLRFQGVSFKRVIFFVPNPWPLFCVLPKLIELSSVSVQLFIMILTILKIFNPWKGACLSFSPTPLTFH